jgi:hypothetical protein
MLQTNLTRRAENALQALEDAAPLLEVINALDAMNSTLQSHLSGIAVGGGNAVAEYANAMHADFASLNRTTRSQNVRAIFRDVENLSNQLSKALCEDLDDPSYVKNGLLVELDTFADAYNAYVTHQTGAYAVPLLLAVQQVKASLLALRGFLHYTLSNSSGLLLNEGEAELSLVLVKISGVADFAGKLAALQNLYDELSNLLSVSTASHPLRIGKIESGSLWTRLFGDMKVVSLMITFIEETARFVHRNYTQEGKIASIPTKIESMNSILDFTSRLKEAGVDVSAAEDALAKSAVVMAKSLNILVTDQPLVEVNGKVLSAGHEVQQALLANSVPRKLEYSAPVDLTVTSKPSSDA